MFDGKRARLGDVISLKSGNTPSKSNSEYWGGAHAWASAKDMKRFYIDSTIDTLSDIGIAKASQIVEKGTTLILTRGMTLLKYVPVCVVKNQTAFNQDLKAITPKDGFLEPEFIPYLLLGNLDRIHALVDLAGHGTGRLATEAFLDLDVFIPIKSKREFIIKLFQGLDNKIELNRQTNQALEQMAQAIFKSWFVDFDPTRAKIAAKLNGQDPERAAMATISGKAIEELEQLSPDTQQQLRTTAALFPDKLVDSELGEIPKGWEVGDIGSIANAKGGYAFKGNSFVEEGNPVVKIKNITGDGRVDLKSTVCIDDEQAKKAERFKLSDGDLLMAMTGATVGKIGFVVTEGKSIYLNQRVAKFESEKFGKQISWFLYCCLQRDSIFDAVVGAAYGSAQPNISSSVIESIEFIVPHHDLIFNFCEFAESLFNKWISNISENSLLEKSRDSLLPKLLSGELVISTGA